MAPNEPLLGGDHELPSDVVAQQLLRLRRVHPPLRAHLFDPLPPGFLRVSYKYDSPFYSKL